MNRKILYIAIAFLWAPAAAFAQVPIAYYDYVRSDLEWYTIETEHFLIHFHSDSSGTGSRTARVVAKVAEDVFEPITRLYDYKPDTKVSFILKDYEDYSNGAAYFFDNMIEIWAPALSTAFRGDHNWLRNVITHEFTHMVQVQKTMKTTRKVPFLYLQYLDYENVRRPDVLYGFPNVLASYPIPILNNPAWLAEGTAQYQREWMEYDTWDSHRDMLLRTQILSGHELSLSEMGGFYSHTGLMRESVYNHGFAFTQYLADRFSEDALRVLSQALGKWNNWNFRQAAEDAFGITGDTIYEDWIASLRDHYIAQTPEASAAVDYVESEGFNNFYARISPDGSQIAYLSNRGQDFSRTSIWLKDVNAQGMASAPRMVLPAPDLGLISGYTCSQGHRILAAATGPISWLPDGRLVYSRTHETSKGYLYLDLYALDVSTQKSDRLTRNQRAFAPAVAPDGAHIAFVQQGDGTTNLELLSLRDNSIRALTEFADGSQVSDPQWSPDGQWIYFGLSRGQGRDIYRVSLSGSPIEVVLNEAWDERSPTFDSNGMLVYASDKNGIFNLYRLSSDASTKALTNESGGAFMPTYDADGRLYYSRYESSGYKIVRFIEATEEVKLVPYRAPAFLSKAVRREDPGPAQRSLNPPDDSAVRSFSGVEMDSIPSYRPVFTSFSFLPVLRLDQYVSRKRSRNDVRLKDRSRSGTLWRNTKFGFYSGTREVLGGLSFFGGLLIGPGSGDASSLGDFLSPSNLLDLERDVFMQIDYNRGLPFWKRRWSPQFSIQLFNVRRNVENGLSIEEFPCTACFPDSTLIDLSYNLWEVDLVARSKISRVLLAEAGYRYSPYRVTTNRFFSRELKQSIPSSSSRYFIGRAYHANLIFESFHAYRDMNVVPHGIRAELGLEIESGRLLNRFDIEDGILTPIYERSSVNRLSFNARAGARLPGWKGEGAHGIGVRFRATTILGGEVDDFYDDYVGGLTGARGYPFYALGGNETLWLQLAYSFPLLPRVGRQFMWMYVDKVYMRVFGDAALAWSGPWPGLGNVRKDAGAELRFGLGSFYLLPTALFISGTYGLDSFNFQLDEGFVTPDGKTSVRYGRSWQWHVGMLFGFDQL